MITAYPLTWPDDWRRTPVAERAHGRFNKRDRSSTYRWKQDITIADGVARVLHELRAMGIEDDDLVVSTNVPVRLDGKPRSDAKAPADPGAAVYWQERAGATRCIAVDRYHRVADNLAAIAATLDAMRAIERHGGAQILDRVFRGFAALPAPSAARAWHDVLGVPADCSLEFARAAYRRLAAEHHPDRGGSAERMAEINRAWEQVQEATRC